MSQADIVRVVSALVIGPRDRRFLFLRVKEAVGGAVERRAANGGAHEDRSRDAAVRRHLAQPGAVGAYEEVFSGRQRASAVSATSTAAALIDSSGSGRNTSSK